MAQKSFLPKPGVNTLPSALLAGETWVASSLVRFIWGFIEKLSGCQRLSSATFTGVARVLHAWADLSGLLYAAVGTTQRLELYNNGNIYDITPIRATDNLTTAFSTTDGSSIVTIIDNAAQVAVGDWVNVTTAVNIANLLIQGLQQVTAVVGGGYEISVAPQVANATVASGGTVPTYVTTNGSHSVEVGFGGYTFTNGQSWLVYNPVTVGGLTLSGSFTITVTGGIAYITSLNAATSNASQAENSGNAQVAYLLESSQENMAQGYGSGLYGEGAYGVSNSTPALPSYRAWSEDNWGQDLVACLRGGTIYVWIPPIAYNNVAAQITNAPPYNTGIFVGMPQQQLIAFGSTDPTTGEWDPMLVRFTDVADYTDWTASATNQAGSFRLSNGSRIIAALQGPQQGLLWTNVDLWAMIYSGYPYVYGFERIGWGCGALSQRCIGAAGPNLYWPGVNGFFLYDGAAVLPLPCPVWDYFFSNLDPQATDLIFAAPNSDFNEIAWHFPLVGAQGQISSYIKFNYSTNVWDIGADPDYARTAWSDRSILGAPMGTDYNGLIQQHEIGTALDGAAMNSWVLSGWMPLTDGAEYIFLNKLLPDFILGPGSTVQITVYVIDFMGDLPRMYGPYSVTSATDYLVIRARGRYLRLLVQSNDRVSYWRLGRLEGQVAPAGRR